MTVNLTWGTLGVECTYAEFATVRAAMSAAKQISAGPRFEVLTYCIHDFSASTEIEIGAVTVAILASQSWPKKALNPNLRVAIIVPPTSSPATVNSSLHATAAACPTRVFRFSQDAIQWIANSGLV